MVDDLPRYLDGKRALVENRLRETIPSGDGCPLSLAEAMRYSLLTPGKRLRPLLVILAAEASGGTDTFALPAACAVEMVHTYSLIHDDLPAMDDDDLRRGLPTCHKKYGEALAILAGDGLLTLAFQVLSESYPAEIATACCRELARGAGPGGMVGGQVDDLAMEKRCGAANLKELESLHARKTGALFRAALRMGVLTARGGRVEGPDSRLLNCIDHFGRCLGLVFQITDDLLDVQSSTEQTGKRVNKDAARGKLTYPGLLGIQESRRWAGQLGREAQEALSYLGPAGERLAELAQTFLERDR
jgi:geranylgeranyl diphosphate synthase type II